MELKRVIPDLRVVALCAEKRTGFIAQTGGQRIIDTMYEPKYKLNRRDAKRWHDLLVRHCLEAPEKTPKQQRAQKKYPPLTPAENVEFEALCEKRSKKIESHPKVKASIARSKRQIRKVEKLMKKLEKLMKKLKRRQVKIKVDGKR